MRDVLISQYCGSRDTLYINENIILMRNSLTMILQNIDQLIVSQHLVTCIVLL